MYLMMGRGGWVGANVGHVAPESGKDYCTPMWKVESTVGELCIKLYIKIVSPEFSLFSFLLSLICASYSERVSHCVLDDGTEKVGWG